MEQIWVLTRTDFLVCANGAIDSYSEENGLVAFSDFEKGKEALRAEIAELGSDESVRGVFNAFLDKVDFRYEGDAGEVRTMLDEVLDGKEPHVPLIEDEYYDDYGVSYEADSDIPRLMIGANTEGIGVPVLHTNAIVMNRQDWRYFLMMENWNGKAHKYSTIALTPAVPN